MTYLPSTALVNKYFTRKRGVAVGIASLNSCGLAPLPRRARVRPAEEDL